MGTMHSFGSTVALRDYINKHLPFSVIERSVNLSSLYCPRSIVESTSLASGQKKGH
jgi:hypothetical protein